MRQVLPALSQAGAFKGASLTESDAVRRVELNTAVTESVAQGNPLAALQQVKDLRSVYQGTLVSSLSQAERRRVEAALRTPKVDTVAERRIVAAVTQLVQADLQATLGGASSPLARGLSRALTNPEVQRVFSGTQGEVASSVQQLGAPRTAATSNERRLEEALAGGNLEQAVRFFGRSTNPALVQAILAKVLAGKLGTVPAPDEVGAYFTPSAVLGRMLLAEALSRGDVAAARQLIASGGRALDAV